MTIADGYLSSFGGEEKVLEYVVMLAAGIYYESQSFTL